MIQKWILASICLLNLQALAEKREFQVPGLREFKLAGASGKVNIRAESGQKSVVVNYFISSPQIFKESCLLEISQAGSKVVARVEGKHKRSFKDECEVDFDILLPEGKDLELYLGNGKVKLAGAFGDIESDGGAADFTLNGSVKNLKVKTGRGEILAGKIGNKANVRSGSGSIELEFSEGRVLDLKCGSGSAKIRFDTLLEDAELDFSMGNGNLDLFAKHMPKSGEIKASLGNGNATFKLDPQASFRLSQSSGFFTGSSNEFGNSSNSKFHINVSHGTGALKITKL